MASNFTEVKKMELSYNPVIHHHAPPANPSSSHYNTPVQVARPLPLAVPQQQSSRGPSGVQASHQSKYGELLNVIEDLGREIKPTYAGSKMAQERLKKGIMHARTLVRECLAEVDKSARQ